MIALRRLNTLACAVAGLACTGFLLADDKPALVLLALPMVVVAWASARWSRSSSPRGAALPSVVVSLLVLAGVIYAATTTAGTTGQPVVSILGLFLVFITVVKLFDRRSSRDDAQLLTLCVFVVIASVLTSNALSLGLVLTLLFPLALAAVMLWQLTAGQELMARAHERARASTGPGPALAVTQPITPPAAWSQLTRLIAMTTAGALALATAIFLVTPRGIASDVLGRFGRARETTIGFTDQARLGMSGFLRDDPTPVMDVEVLDGEGVNLGSNSTMLYLRGAVKHAYDPETGSWMESPEDATPERRGRSGTSRGGEFAALRADRDWMPFPDDQRALSISTSVRVQKISMRRSSGSGTAGTYLFGTWKPASLVLEREAQVSITAGDRVVRATTSSPLGFSGPSGRLNYTLRSLSVDEGGAEPEPPDRSVWPEPIRDLADRIIAESPQGVPTDETALRVRAAAMRDYLRTNFSYSLEMIAPAPGQDPLEMFLFTNRRGHCEYFASAMVALCQSVGVPARLVLGYVSGEFNPLTGRYVVRESNAHAWVEVHVGRGRWVTMDPSPPAEIERIHRADPGIASTLRSWWDALEVSWARSVVSFDSGSQVRLLGRGLSSAMDGRRFDDLAGRLATMARTRGAGGFRDRLQAFASDAGYVVVGAAVLGAIGYAAWRVGRRALEGRRSRSDADRRALREARFFSLAETLLRRAKLGRPFSRPPVEHARELAQVDRELAGAWEQIAVLFYRVRFGGVTLSGAELAEGDAALQKLRTALDRRDQALRARSGRSVLAPGR
jgi:protein-glutamine gamma-glutamyltransferase